MRDDRQRAIFMRFFKTGPGEYGEGDRFLGIMVPSVRRLAKDARDLPLDEIPQLLTNEWHEVRLCGFLILTYKMERLCRKRVAGTLEAIRERDAIVRLYLEYADHANNWDLVDLSAPKIIGPWLLLPSEMDGSKMDDSKMDDSKTDGRQMDCSKTDGKRAVMDELAASPVLWRQRIAMVSTWKTTQQGDPSYALHYAEVLLHHPHDLMHKAVGWMLREVGKRCGKDLLEDFLEQHAADMPRTALRYAIEKLPDAERRYWMTRRA